MKKSILILFFAIFAFATVSVSANETTDDTKTKITSVDDTKVKSVSANETADDTKSKITSTDDTKVKPVEVTNNKTSEKEGTIENNLDTEALYCYIKYQNGSVKKCWFCKCEHTEN